MTFGLGKSIATRVTSSPTSHIKEKEPSMSRITTFAFLLVIGVVGLGAGCHKDGSNDKAANRKSAEAKAGDTLWYRLGGEKAVRAVVHDFVGRGAANPKVNFTRKGKPNEWKPTPKDLEKLEQRLVEFI